MSIFSFKHFQIQQANSALKVGNDAMLLGAIADFGSASSILDVGCGTGVLACMIAQRFPTAQVDGVEVDEAALRDAKHNFSNARFSNLNQVFSGKVETLELDTLYEGIICNPPYYETNQLGKSTDLNLAKHVGSLTPEVLAKHLFRLTTNSAKVWMIWPSENAQACSQSFEGEGWHLSEEISVYGKPNRLKRLIWCWEKSQPIMVSKSIFTVRDVNGQLTDQYRKLTNDFHDRPV